MKICRKCKISKNISCFGNNSRLKDKKQSQCKKCHNEYNKIKRTKKEDPYVGKRFGIVHVIQKTDIKKGNNFCYLCLCDCGKEKLIRGGDLKTRESCGCLHVQRVANLNKLPKGEAALNGLISVYKFRAKKAKLSFCISKEIFVKLISNKCYYCSDDPKNHKYVTNNGVLVYNGLDRVDNTLGYTVDNVVTCCAECNWMKGEMSREDFFIRMKKILKNIENKNEHLP